MASESTTVRRFNRTYTQRIGALEESFLGTGRPLGVSRVLFEIGPGGATARDLRQRLDLDSGYLTRLLRRLVDDELVEISPDPEDGRRRLVTLTRRGHDAWRDLDQRSESLARDLVSPLTARQRERLVEALATADLLVRAATVRLRSVPPSDPLALAAVDRYVAELDQRFPGGFDAGRAGPTGAAPTGSQETVDAVFLVATSDGDPVACGAVHPIAPGTAEIKRMWVDPGWRGAGLGSRMLRQLEQEAVRLGQRRIRLDTNRTLDEAIALYRRAGYREIARYNDNPYAELFFEKDLPAEAATSPADG